MADQFNLSQLLGGGLPAGLLSPEQEAAAEQRAQAAGLLNFAFGALQASRGAPGMGRPSLGQVIGQAGPVGVAGYQQSFEDTLKRSLQGMQIAEMRRKQEVAQQLRDITPRLIKAEGGVPEKREVFPTETGDYTRVTPGVAPTYSINMQALPALAALGPEGIAAASELAKFQQMFKPETVTLKPGEKVVEKGTGKVIAGIPATPEKIDLVTHIAFVDPENPTRIIGTLPKGKDADKLTSQELQVGQQFASQAQPFIQTGQAYKKIEVAAKNPSGAGDISLIFGYMKLLDPGSVVREGEFATAQNAGSIPQSIVAAYNRALNGQRLDPKVREDFVNQAKNLVASQQEIFNQTLKPRFDSIVESAGLNARNVMFDPFAGIDVRVTPKPPPPTTGTVPSVKEMVMPQDRSRIIIRRIGD